MLLSAYAYIYAPRKIAGNGSRVCMLVTVQTHCPAGRHFHPFATLVFFLS